jgi:hypothetical protein
MRLGKIASMHVYLDTQLSHAAFAIFAMTSSRVASLALESEMKTAIAKCRAFGSATSPTSLVAAVTPLTVAEVPVLCTTTYNCLIRQQSSEAL